MPASRFCRPFVLMLCLWAVLPARAAPDPEETRRLHMLFEADWQWRMQTFPDWATYLGDHRYGDRLTDQSPAARESWKAYARERLAKLQGFDRNKLSDSDKTSLDILLHDTREDVEGQSHPGRDTQVLTAMHGLHTELAQLLNVVPMRNEADAGQLLARLALVPSRIDQVITILREGIALGWVAFKPSMERVPAQIDGQLSADLAASPLWEPFKRLPVDMPDATRARLQQQGRQALLEHAYPALSKLRRFIVDEYLPRAPLDGAMSRYPGGAAAYDFTVRQQTTTALSAREIHAIGLRETARLHTEMKAQAQRTGFVGDFAAFVRHANTDPRFFHTSAEALLAAHRDIAKRVDPELPKLFAELPRAPYGVRAIPAHEGPNRVEYYSGPAADGSRPGWFNANVVALKARPIWAMESLFLHEAVPGHHLQNARALERGDLPLFRRNSGYNAYSEGWALYAETLGETLGLYKDPYQKFGHLRDQAWRAARLAVDTGIHAMGWSREQAIAWMAEQTTIDRTTVESEVDRYYVWPGQALGYMIGQLKIIELRERAHKALGERFDLRRFHMAVLDQGAVPLAVLEQQIGDWIAAEKAR